MTLTLAVARAVLLACGFSKAANYDLDKVAKTLPKLADLDEDTDCGTAELNEVFNDLRSAMANDEEITLNPDAEEAAEEKPKKGKKGKKAEAPAKPAKKAKKKATEPKKPKGPGVIDSIVEFLKAATEKKPLTKEALHAKLIKRFPDKPESKKSTINIQVPSRLKVDRNIIVHKNTNGYWINANEK